jgi:predicted MFS family arabinose efflux permease
MCDSRWSALAVLTFARTAMGLQFQSVGALSPFLTERLGIGNAELGLLVGLFSLPGIVLAMPGGLLGARFGERPLVLTSLALMAVGSSVIGVSERFAIAMGGRFLTAVGAVLMNVLMTKMLADWFVGREIIWAMTVFINAWPVGIGIALFCLPAVASAWGAPAAFHTAAGMAVVAWVAIALLYRAADPAPGSGAGAAAATPSASEIRLVSLAALPWMLYNAAYAVMLGFLPALLVRWGLSVERAGLLLGASTVLMIMSVLAGGALAQWIAKPHIVVVLGVAGFTAALAVLPYTAVVPAVIAMGVIGGLPAGVFVSAPASVLRPETRGAGMGLFYTWYYAGMSALPPVAGWVQDLHGGAAAIHLAAVFALITLPCYVVFRNLASRPERTRPA